MANAYFNTNYVFWDHVLDYDSTDELYFYFWSYTFEVLARVYSSNYSSALIFGINTAAHRDGKAIIGHDYNIRKTGALGSFFNNWYVAVPCSEKY